jgi:hypothetical protein
MSAATATAPQQQAAASTEEKEAREAAEQWLPHRGVPHFLTREAFEVRPANVGTSLVLAGSFGAVAADEEGLPRWAQVAICVGVVLVWLVGDLGRRRSARKKGPYLWPRPGHLTLAVLVAITTTAAIDAVVEWHDEIRVVLLWAAWVAVALVIAAATPLGTLRVFAWAAGHPFREAARNIKVLAGAIPLLLLTVAFLFMTTEIWHVATFLTPEELGGAVGLFVLLGACFLFVLARSHITEAQRFDGWKDVRACIRSRRADPLAALEAAVTECLDKGASFEDWAAARKWLEERKQIAPPASGDATGPGALLKTLDEKTPWGALGDFEVPDLEWRERWNINIVLLFGQSVQVLAVTLVMAAFLLVFGLLTVDTDTLQAWDVIAEGEEPQEGFPPWSGQHLKVTALLAAFAGLSFAVYAALFKEQREIFFGELDRKATQRLAVRAVYRRLLERNGQAPA